MGMDLVPVYEEAGEEKEPASTIRIDPVTIQNMGVRLAKVERKALVKHIRTVGNITFDETKIFSKTNARDHPHSTACGNGGSQIGPRNLHTHCALDDRYF